VIALLAAAGTAGGCRAPTQAPRPPTSVWAWGFNDYGQIGNGSKIQVSEPIRLSLSDVTQVQASFHNSLALKKDGSVWQWGSLDEEVLTSTPCPNPAAPPGFIACDLTPTQVLGLPKAKSIGAGYGFGLAITDDSDSTICRWGENNAGQLGNFFLEPVKSPVCFGPPDRVLYVDGGGGGSVGGHTVAISSGPPQLTVWSWDHDEHKQVGSAASICGPYDCVDNPTQVKGLADVIGVAAGQEHSLALKSDGTVWAWGSQDRGQLGVPGTSDDTAIPVEVRMNGTNPLIPLDHVRDIAAGGGHSLALRNDGTVWTWGFNNFGQLGVSTAPLDIASSARKVQDLKDIVAIAAGDNFSLALKSDGTVWAWGANDRGQLGAPSGDKCGPKQLPCSFHPIQVRNLTSVTSIAAGGAHSLALARP
jgi:alpha-tubulin suppressor-like RCC1 family protein